MPPSIDVLAEKLYRQWWYGTPGCGEPPAMTDREMVIWRDVARVALGLTPARRP